jgi:hypothetical protein
VLDVLFQVEQALPQLLYDEIAWQSLLVDYHPPTVERLWTNWQRYRVYLHRIHPCEREQALFHPHPWPSAMRVLDGEYEMAVGFGAGSETPPVAALMIARGDFRYEMTHPDSWHYVRPLERPTLSLMVTGKPWDRASPRSDKPLRRLEESQVAELLRRFRALFPPAAGSKGGVAP